MSAPCAGCWQSGGQWKNILRNMQVTMANHWKFPIGSPQPNQISFGVANGCHMKLESEKVVMERTTLKVFTKLLDRLPGVGRGQEEGYESRTIMVLANGM